MVCFILKAVDEKFKERISLAMVHKTTRSNRGSRRVYFSEWVAKSMAVIKTEMIKRETVKEWNRKLSKGRVFTRWGETEGERNEES